MAYVNSEYETNSMPTCRYLYINENKYSRYTQRQIGKIIPAYSSNTHSALLQLLGYRISYKLSLELHFTLCNRLNMAYVNSEYETNSMPTCRYLCINENKYSRYTQRQIGKIIPAYSSNTHSALLQLLGYRRSQLINAF